MIFTISWSDLYTKISKHVIEKYLIIGPYCPPFNAARNKLFWKRAVLHLNLSKFLGLRGLYLCCLASGSMFPSLFFLLDKNVPV